MKEIKFSSTIFDPEKEDPDFHMYKKHLYTLFLILDPLINNRITDEEDILEQIHSALGLFAMYVYKDGLRGRIEN